MKIASSQVSLSSRTQRQTFYQKSVKTTGFGTSLLGAVGKETADPGKDVQDETIKGLSFDEIKEKARKELSNPETKKTSEIKQSNPPDNLKIPDTARMTLRLLITLLRSVGGGRKSVDELDKLLGNDEEERSPVSDMISDFFGQSTGLNPFNMYSLNSGLTRMVNVTEVHAEVTEVTFQGQGMALTEDGRQIDFNVELSMSSSFMRISHIEGSMPVLNLCDPLVINVGSDVTAVSDKKFSFDLNNDGQEDSISLLNQGFGFLSYDRNGNGKIDDGGELFGTSTGNGFGELSKYDSDGNGWIDENDDVWDKLSVWFKNGDGDGELKSLKDADIGAIFLGAARTPFMYRGDEVATSVNGVARKTGMFLRESGKAGLIQHVDFAM